LRERKESTLMSLFGAVLFYLAIALLLPTVVALYYGEGVEAYLYPFVITLFMAIVLLLRYRPSDTIHTSEAFFAVSVGWLIGMCVASAPFILSGYGLVDSMFEAMSGLTTTGSTILSSIEDAPKSLLFWRSLIQWLGGAGIIMVFVAVLPTLGVGGRQLFRGEFPGHDVQSIRLRIRHTARLFFYVYLVFSAALFVILLFARVGVYDSLCIVFSTLSTGGFSPHTESIAYYGSPFVEWVVVVFMFLCGANFYTHYRGLYEHPIHYIKSAEFRAYCIIVGSAIAAVWAAVELAESPPITYGLREAAFQVVSLMSTTGFTTANYDGWPTPVKVLLLMLMVIGGSTGSTAGAMKVARLLISLNFIRLTLYKLVHPSAIVPIKFDDKCVSEDVLSSVAAFVVAYMGLICLSTLLLLSMGLGASDALSASVATIGNVGPGFGGVGPTEYYGWLPSGAKLMLIFNMWAGRLELFTVFVLFLPAFWRELRKKER